MALRATKIVATLGPASSDPALLEEMIRAGVNVVRLNFSHGTAQDNIDRAAMVRTVAQRAGREVANILHAKRNRTIGHSRVHCRQMQERRTHCGFDACKLSRRRPHAGRERRRRGQTAVHFPVTDDEWRAHGVSDISQESRKGPRA